MGMDAKFESVLPHIVEQQGKIADGIFGKGQRPWFNFSDLADVGKFDVDGLHELFNRDSSNDQYASLRAKPDGTVKEMQTAKLSGDFLAGLERDLHARRRSRIRSFVHGGNRTVGNSKSKGALSRNTLDWMGRMLADKKEPQIT